MFDSHCHFDHAAFDPDRAACLQRARAAGVSSLLIPSVSRDNWGAVRACADRYGLPFALGTHPLALPGLPEEAPVLPEDLSGACAIGECGLDGGVPVAMERQEAVLRAQLIRARELDLPVILHAVRCHDRLPALLRPFAPLAGVLHSYSGGAELVAVYERLGLHLSFGPIVMNPAARRPVAALQRVRADRLLLESDGPDQRMMPEGLSGLAAAAALHRGEAAQAVAVQTATNAARLFRLRLDLPAGSG